METNSTGHENKYHLQVTFEDKTDQKNREKATLSAPKALLHKHFSAATTLLLQQQNILIKLHLVAITMHKQHYVHAANSFSRANISKIKVRWKHQRPKLKARYLEP